MKFKSAKNIVLLAITWILLVQVINLSIDPTDPVPFKSGKVTACEDLTINEIESIYELVSEQCMGVEVPEHDDSDHQGSFVKVMTFFFVNSSIKFREQHQQNRISFFISDEALPSFDIELLSPPPKLG